MMHAGSAATNSTLHTVILADARSLHEVADRSVHLVVTSPPYWQLKDYNTDAQIGFHDSYEDYINDLNCVWQECHRVLHDGCRLCINIGDQFARSAYYGRYKVIPIRTEIIRFCETVGFDYMGAIIWQKVTTCNTTGGGTVMGSFPYPRNGIVKLDYEFILIFKKPGQSPRVSPQIKEQSRLTNDEWNQFFNGHWTFPGERQEKHIAAFPVELPRRLIRMFTFAGETVLDPFAGSGTTAVAAHETGRNSIGYEINPEFEATIMDRLRKLDGGNVSVQHRNASEKPDSETMRARLPYRFTDPVKLDASKAARETHYGSRVSKASTTRESYRRVVAVHDVDLVEFDGGECFRLSGIAPVGQTNGAAVAWLREFVKGHKVYTRDDEALSADDAGNRRGFLYLSNRTFVNARLIREGRATLEPTTPCSKLALLRKYAERSTDRNSRDDTRS